MKATKRRELKRVFAWKLSASYSNVANSTRELENARKIRKGQPIK